MPSKDLSFYWEFGGADVVASVRVGTEVEWCTSHAWASQWRAEFLDFVAADVVRQKAPNLDDAIGWIDLRQDGAPPSDAPPPAGPLPLPPPSTRRA